MISKLCLEGCDLDCQSTLGIQMYTYVYIHVYNLPLLRLHIHINIKRRILRVCGSTLAELGKNIKREDLKGKTWGHAQPPAVAASVYCACRPRRTDVHKSLDLRRELTPNKNHNATTKDEFASTLYIKAHTYKHKHTHTPIQGNKAT